MAWILRRLQIPEHLPRRGMCFQRGDLHFTSANKPAIRKGEGISRGLRRHERDINATSMQHQRGILHLHVIAAER